ncbi:MAG: hypothetical protein AAEJ04_00885, partial [Planctomycetota bacterium]
MRIFTFTPLLLLLSMTSLLAFGQTATLLNLSVEDGERVIVVLKDGSEVIGEVVEENDEKISIKSVFGVTSIEMGRIESVIRGAEVD